MGPNPDPNPNPYPNPNPNPNPDPNPLTLTLQALEEILANDKFKELSKLECLKRVETAAALGHGSAPLPSLPPPRASRPRESGAAGPAASKSPASPSKALPRLRTCASTHSQVRLVLGVDGQDAPELAHRVRACK